MAINTKLYIEKFLKIKDKKAKIVPLTLNKPQMKLYNALGEQYKQGKPQRAIVLKSRQMGFSTLKQEDLHAGNSIDEAAAIFKSVLENSSTKAQQDVVVANSALAIRIVCPTKSIAECKQEALVSLQSGKAATAFKHFLESYKG